MVKKKAVNPRGPQRNKKAMFEDFKVAAINSGGILLPIAKKMDIPYNTLVDFVKSNKYGEACQEILHNEREKITDLAEKNLFQKINDKSFPAIKFYLSTKGKDRGYVERQEVDQQTTLQGAGFQLNVVMPEGLKEKLDETKKSKKQ